MADKLERNETDASRLQRLNDSLAYLLLAWPVPLLWPLLPAGVAGMLLAAVALSWLALVVAHAAQRHGEPRFAAAVLAATACVSLAVWAHPSPWLYLWVTLALLFHHTGQRILLAGERTGTPAGAGSTADEKPVVH